MTTRAPTSRKRDDAMIRDPDAAVANVRSMVHDGVVISTSGKRVPVVAHSICVHGDEPTGPAVARAVRAVWKRTASPSSPSRCSPRLGRQQT